MLNRESIIAADDLKKIEVDTPEWGGKVCVRMMTGSERDSLAASLRDAAGVVNMDGYRAKLLVRCIVGEDGNRLFTDADIALLGAKSTLVLDRLFTAADTLNATSAAAVEEAEKN